jgi:hypothetical protein
LRTSLRSLVVLPAAAALVAAGVWLLTADGERRGGGLAESAPSAESGGEPPVATAEHAARTAPALWTKTNLTRGPASLSGKVLVDAPDGSDAPAVKIEVRPSRFVKGKETADSRDVDVGPNRRFAAEGLPFGAYRVQPVAAGYSGMPVEVKLDEAARHADVVVRLRRNPSLVGFVRDATRAPVESALVTIAGKTETGDAFSFEGRTASDGSFRVASVPDGVYSVNVGPTAVRLRPPVNLTVRDGAAPQLLIDVPELAAIDVRVLVLGVDVPLEGVVVVCVRAELDKGGEVETLTTDAEGRV